MQRLNLKSRYKTILVEFGIDNLEDQTIVKRCDETWGPIARVNTKNAHFNIFETLEQKSRTDHPPISIRKLNLILYLVTCKNWSMKSLNARFKIPIDDIKQCLRWQK